MPKKDRRYQSFERVQQRGALAVKNRYTAKAYDRINLIVKKGQKEVIQAHAQKRNESVNGFINRAIEEAMQRDDEKES